MEATGLETLETTIGTIATVILPVLAVAAMASSLSRRPAHSSSRRIRIRRRLPSLLSRWSPLLGLAFSLAPSGAVKASPSPLRDAAPVQHPWLPADEDPPPSSSAGAGEPRPPWHDAAHPAIHGRGAPGRVDQLFPRAQPSRNGRAAAGKAERPDPMLPPVAPRATSDGDARSSSRAGQRAEKLACMARHPAGRDQRVRGGATRNPARHHVVRAGDTLWSIAGEVLATEDLARIARYWPRIHRANRKVIGSDPGLIRPGQVLLLPSEAKPSHLREEA